MEQMNYRIAELIALQERRALESSDVRWRVKAEATAPKRSLMREFAASALVRIGMVLDQDAVERAALVARSASR